MAKIVYLRIARYGDYNCMTREQNWQYPPLRTLKDAYLILKRLQGINSSIASSDPDFHQRDSKQDLLQAKYLLALSSYTLFSLLALNKLSIIISYYLQRQHFRPISAKMP